MKITAEVEAVMMNGEWGFFKPNRNYERILG